MNANARRVHRIVVGFGVACAVAAALPCLAADTGSDKKSTSAPAEENVGFFSGLAIGAVAGGPIGAVAGGITGALIGEHYHKQKARNQQLAMDLSGSNADKAKLTQTIMQLDQVRNLTLNIAFRTGDANLTADSIDQLTTLGQLAGGLAGVKIRVSGYADPRGSKQFNATLSKDRAESVAAVLTNSGLDPDRVVIEALGDDGAVATGNLDDYAFQRRVSVKLVDGGSVADVPQPAISTVAQAQ
jgi:outer membrane protein OmpA-like peptidoglycan-associated protein